MERVEKLERAIQNAIKRLNELDDNWPGPVGYVARTLAAELEQTFNEKETEKERG